MIQDEIRKIFSPDSERKMAEKTGLKKDKIHWIRNDRAITLNAELIKAVEKLGYEIVLRKLDKPEKAVSMGLNQLHPIKPRKKVDLDEQVKLCRENHMSYGQMQAAKFVVGLRTRAMVSGNGTL